jgi:hypothetical protein
MPSRESHDRVLKALVVDEAHPEADWIDYIQQQSRADDGRRVSEDHA